MRNLIPWLAAAAVIASPACAADVTFILKGDDGTTLPDAVVIVKPAGGASAGAPVKFSWPMVMAQQNIAFNPYVLVVPVGSTVGFPNKDKVRHHVYSFSPTKKFELKLYGQQEERTIVFDKAGIVALGCNIHDSMIGYIYVTDSAFAAKTNAAGEVVIRGLPAGGATLTIWHPDGKARTGTTKTITVAAAGGRDNEIVELRPMGTRIKH